MKHIKCDFRSKACLTPLVGSKGKNSTFSEHGHVAYQITGNHECSNMVAKSLPTDAPIPYPPLTLGMGSVGQNSTFSEQGNVTISNYRES